ncbi:MULTISPECIES: hypothetical protein [Halococcus]|uniref:Uncharacterized protein n=1 Tax=Halococcus thailandensis JCM 13552 TaxID=1227457 RepID=M0NC33_9EURY|nr:MULTISPECIES: hypothetical protein [Halococcus]EMA54240.1 hypothetical protein C451_06997 [Halococcus thailandensis JCM 13552]
MAACPLCGAGVSEERPRHCVTLEIEDTTRSTKQFMGDEADIKRYCVDRQVCPDCWDDLRTKLS